MARLSMYTLHAGDDVDSDDDGSTDLQLHLTVDGTRDHRRHADDLGHHVTFAP